MTGLTLRRVPRRPAAQTGKPSEGPTHLRGIDGLRAIAACSVLLFHGAMASQAEVNTSWGRVVFEFRVGVPIFFLISGFLLYRPFFRERWQGKGMPSLREYFKRRFVRIVPAYWAALTVYAIWTHLPGVFTDHFWIYYGFGQIYSPHTQGNGLGVAWSLCVEVSFYLLLPALAWSLTRLDRAFPKRPPWQIDVAALSALWVAANLFRAWEMATGRSYLSVTLPAMFDFFVPGMLLAVASIVLEGRGIGSLPRGLEAIADRPSWCWAAAAALACIEALLIDSRTVVLHPDQVSQVSFYVDHFFQAGIALLIVLPALLGGDRGGLPRRLLSLPAVAWLGIVSYGIYLWHQNLMVWLVGRGIFNLGGPRLPILIVATFIPTVAIAAISWYALERPLLQRFRSVGARRLS